MSCGCRAAVVLRLVCLLFSALVAAGEDCGADVVQDCFTSLVHYETLVFPLYGKDEMELDETCNALNNSFDCIHSYIATCNGREDCDDECKEMIADIGVFSLNTGLQELQQELCNPQSAMRLTYLENYMCLEDNADRYASCHNDSQLSQEYLTTIKSLNESVNARCCFFSWYQDCFTNITKDNCNGNATFFVSFSLHKLVGHIAQHICEDNPVQCSRPPMVPDTSSQALVHSLNSWLLMCTVAIFTYVFSIK